MNGGQEESGDESGEEYDKETVVHDSFDSELKRGPGTALDVILPFDIDGTKPKRMLTVVCISDTHCLLSDVEIPDGDVLLCAGDMTETGRYDELCVFDNLLSRLPHTYKFCVEGNHEAHGSCSKPWEALSSCRMLRNERVQLNEGPIIYGCSWKVKPRKEDLEGVDILLTHAPPPGYRPGMTSDESEVRLLAADSPGGLAIASKPRACPFPSVHVFGHNHAGHGIFRELGTNFINAACCEKNGNSAPRRSALWFRFPSKM